MALFQPTNIIPSSFTVGVVDADRDVASVSWQVNGNSPMTAFKIDFLQNNTYSTFITSTGKQPITGGFYGTDRFGQPKMFTWDAGEKWNSYDIAFANGNQYKFKITQYWQEGGEEKYIEQIEPSVFATRTMPSLNIQRSATGDFSNPTDFSSGSTLPASVGYFVGNYSQAQGAPVREVRWQVATWINENIGEILADTGDVDTPTLQYEFNGFFIGNEYAVRCSGKADYQTYGTQDFDSKWTNFTVNLPDGQKQSTYFGEFSVQYLYKENATLLKWDPVEVITPTISPDGFNPKISNGAVELPAKDQSTEYSVKWEEKIIVEDGQAKTTPLNFTAPWCAVWKGQLTETYKIKDFTLKQTVDLIKEDGYLLKYSPDGKYLFQYSFPYLKIYTVTNDGIILNGYITSGGVIYKSPIDFNNYFGTNNSNQINDFAFSSKNNFFAVGTSSFIYLYTFKDGNLNRLSSADNDGKSVALTFSPNGEYLVAGGAEDDEIFNIKGWPASIYSISNNQLTFSFTLKDESSDEIKANGMCADFNWDGSILCLGTMNGAYLFSFDKGSASYIQKLPYINYCSNCTFSKNEYSDILIVCNSGRKEDVSAGWYQFKIISKKPQFVKKLDEIPDSLGINRAVAFSPTEDNLLIGNNNNLYWYEVEKSQLNYKGTVNLTTWGEITAVTWDQKDNQISVYNLNAQTQNNSIVIFYPNFLFYPIGKLFELQGSDIQLVASENVLSVLKGEKELARLSYTSEATQVTIIITPTTVKGYLYGKNGYLKQVSFDISYSQETITSVEIYGGDSGATIYSVSIYKGEDLEISNLYQNVDFEPIWNSGTYLLYLTANFNGNLDGGTGTSAGDGFRIYRQELGSNILTPIANLQSTETSLKDFGVRSRKKYIYSLYAYDSNQAFMKSVQNDAIISTCFKNYSLLVCDYDSKRDAYHVRKQYLFALNLSADSESNNNSPTLNKNFTPYPTRMPDTSNHISGTLQGLIGAIYTVSALVEQIGSFKHTVKPSTLDYFDSVDLEQELYELSTAPYQLFLRDMKGHLRMVTINNQIRMTPDLKKRQIPLTISFPWVEIGDASDVTIIQTPEDYGWNNDGQVLDVRLDVDPTTGILTANYPKPYTGTKFYLTGANNEILRAKTPLGVTPAQFALSEKANEPDDGILSATAKVNTEEGG